MRENETLCHTVELLGAISSCDGFFHKQLYAGLLETKNRTRLRANISWAQNDANFITTNIGLKLFLLVTNEFVQKQAPKSQRKKSDNDFTL